MPEENSKQREIDDHFEVKRFIDYFGVTEVCAMLVEWMTNGDMEYFINHNLELQMKHE